MLGTTNIAVLLPPPRFVTACEKRRITITQQFYRTRLRQITPASPVPSRSIDDGSGAVVVVGLPLIVSVMLLAIVCIPSLTAGPSLNGAFPLLNGHPADQKVPTLKDDDPGSTSVAPVSAQPGGEDGFWMTVMSAKGIDVVTVRKSDAWN